MTKANIGLGVLSIPKVFMAVGMAPGVILLFILMLIVMCE
jgi:amino acid permease